MCCRHAVEYVPVNLGTIQDFVERGRLDASHPITMRDLHQAGILNKVKHGVKLLATGANSLALPLNIEVSQASRFAFSSPHRLLTCPSAAIQAVEKLGGKIECAYYNKVALRALLKVPPCRFTRAVQVLQPEQYAVTPRRALPKRVELLQWYKNSDNRGCVCLCGGMGRHAVQVPGRREGAAREVVCLPGGIYFVMRHSPRTRPCAVRAVNSYLTCGCVWMCVDAASPPPAHVESIIPNRLARTWPPRAH